MEELEKLQLLLVVENSLLLFDKLLNEMNTEDPVVILMLAQNKPAIEALNELKHREG